ncbi:Elongation factor 1-gamma 2 [Penicillium atrosanguineum]|uniref:Elongation factor 1-gamma 2 n=1 Tax=Penicillium atrosanguineum TaxID=1132637 RepID=A0A9W9GRD7_9EURO|nr:Enhancer of polycomb-like protein 1 [Penicillium atrosanguineum]KAJ5127610.1 Elongation factor 1-gamma 2 [Penicillium atrosanguineum]KAJ5147819.1 Elongation factor 1-gamma 2 [Penicillium atrosanguineum]KAJ5313710.1 Enhancer of polycomb-like protein 1 [Penicillium atrosanguineum]KAJ5330882.1 Elongation factor 1-gamma 2 [Penicillium atrosanguineum]
MAFGKLYGLPDNGRTIATLVAAKHNGLELDLVKTEANAAKNSGPEYRKVQPLGKIPAFEGANGFNLSEAIAIAIYVTSQNEKTTLLGKTKQDYASIVSWMSFANSEVIPSLGAWYRPLLGLDPYNKKTVDEVAKVAVAKIAVLETHLTANTYLVGERITLADIFTASLLTRAFATVLDKKFRQANPAVTRWYNTIVNQADFKAVYEAKFTEEVIKYVAPKKEEKPKAAAPAAAAEPEAAPAPKPKHPLEALGKPTLILDEWKRQYSNEDTRTVAMPWFWKEYKPEEYSLWKVAYKYNDELKLTFMANNLIGGFHARLEASRKYLFGCQHVFGANYACVIEGVFLVRGQEAAPAFDVAPDHESYSFTKLDPNSEADRKYIEDIWAWDTSLVVDGKELPSADGHVFK